MKATDLMLGDWISLYNTDKKDYTDIQVTLDLFVSLSQNDSAANFKPIQLTSDIMEKNGWSTAYKGVFDSYKELPFSITLRPYVYASCSRDYNALIALQYVHELQHILRLFGYSEDADNLKVK